MTRRRPQWPHVPTRPTRPSSNGHPSAGAGWPRSSGPTAGSCGRGGADRRLVRGRAGHAVPRPAGHRRGAPAPGRAAAALGRRRHARRHRRHRGLRRRPDLAVHHRRPAGHARPADGGLRPPAAPVARLLHPHPGRRGAVAADQRHRRHAVGGHLDRDVGRLQRHHRRRHGGRDGRAELAAVPALPGRAAAGDLADPPGRPHAPHDHRRSASGTSPTCTPRSRRACRSAACCSARPSAPARRSRARFTGTSRRPGRPRGPLAAGRPLADGHDEHRLRRHPGADLPGRRPARDVRRHDDRHAGRLHRPAGHAVPPADGPARRRRHADQLDGAVQPDLRVPRPAGRHRRPGAPGRASTRAAVRGEVRFEHVGFRYPDGAAAGADRRRPRPCPPAARWRWSARPARARARWPRWSPGSTTRRPAGC